MVDLLHPQNDVTSNQEEQWLKLYVPGIPLWEEM